MKSFINYLRGACRRAWERFDFPGLAGFIVGALLLAYGIHWIFGGDIDQLFAGACVGGLIVRSFTKPEPKPFTVRSVPGTRSYGNNS